MKSQASTHEVSFKGGFLSRGFWLYVWVVKPPVGPDLHYVGRTGDNSSPNAQSPFVRMGQHLGFAKTSCMLRTHLVGHKVNPDECSFRLIAHGPVLPEANPKEMRGHTVLRNRVAAVEKALACAMAEAGYKVMNTVKCTFPEEPELFELVKVAFGAEFSRLTSLKATGIRRPIGVPQ